MDKTPRTGSMIRAGAHDDDFERGINLCRRLEAELAEAQAEIERKDKLIERMQDALRWVLTDARLAYGENLVKAAYEAAERGK